MQHMAIGLLAEFSHLRFHADMLKYPNHKIAMTKSENPMQCHETFRILNLNLRLTSEFVG